MPRVSLDSQLKLLPGKSYRLPAGSAPPVFPTPPPPKVEPPVNPNPSVDTNNRGSQKTLQQVCREEIENLHGIFVCWFKGLQPQEELERELHDRITTNFSHIAPNGQFLKGRANLLHNLGEKYNAYPSKSFDIQIENVKVIWTLNDLCLVTYEEWQWWRDIDTGAGILGGSASGNMSAGGSDDVVRFGRLSSCLLKQRPGNFHWIHVHETWLEGVGPNDVFNTYDDNGSTSSGSYDVEFTNKTAAALNDKKKKKNKTPGVDMSLGYGDPTVNGDKDDGNHHVRFSKEREEVSYAYKKVHHDHKEGTDSVSTENSNRGASKTLAVAATKPKEKAIIQLTPVPPTVQAPSNASRRRHISPQLTDYAKACMVNNELIGISIHGWDIGTGQGPMGDEGWFSAATTNFENVAQFRSSGNSDHTRRRIALPEMVFPAAHAAFEHRQENLWISWDVLDAMDDWAKAHQRIPIDSDKEHNGVSVLKSEDAALWAKKKKNILPDGAKSKDQFHFDWTYSSPFSGSVEGGYWEQLPQSGLRLEMLKDKNVPILFFDELVLYEDDLHDNGQVQYSMKIRVMPTCGFVLARLWVRIDRVMLRLRETRVLFEFGKTPDDNTQIYRDVSWRECQWKDLEKHKLPTNLKVWCSEGHETPQLAMLMSKLPQVDVPPGIYKHAILRRGGKTRR